MKRRFVAVLTCAVVAAMLAIGVPLALTNTCSGSCLGDPVTCQCPGGYEIVRRPRDADTVEMADMGGEDQFAAVRFAFNIHNEAVLVCWEHESRHGAEAMSGATDLPDPNALTVAPRASKAAWPYVHLLLLRTDTGGNRPTHWPLILPEDTAALAAFDPLNFQFQSPDADHPLIITLAPLTLDRTRLDDMVYDCLHLTGGDGALHMTLDWIEQRIADHRSR